MTPTALPQSLPAKKSRGSLSIGMTVLELTLTFAATFMLGMPLQSPYQWGLWLIAAVGMQAVTLISPLSAAVQAVARDRRSDPRWDLLVMTDPPATDVILLRWWQVTWNARMEIVQLVVLRAGLMIWAIGEVAQWQSMQTGVFISLSLGQLFLALALLLPLTILSAAFATACGILSSLIAPRSGIGGAVILRTLLLMSVVGLAGITALRPEAREALLTVFTNGAVTIWAVRNSTAWLMGWAAALVILVMLTLTALALALFAARRLGLR
jgi:hypothetical protein